MGLVDLEDLAPAEQEEWSRRNAKFVREMRLNLARDLSTRNVAVDLLARDQNWDLFGVYFRSVDLSHHLTWRFHRGDSGGDGATKATVVRRYHEFMDGVVGDVLAQVPDDATILLLSDHGFEDTYDHRRGPDGFAILAGAPFGSGTDRGRVSVYDVAPTVAVLLGLPVPQDVTGQPREDLLDPAWLTRNPIATVPTWDREGKARSAGGAAAEASDAAEIERLRALGYIQ
jgi:predicted AlkP superfamily phosphohydrolase/phosphomutase